MSGTLFALLMIILFCIQGLYNGSNSIDEVLFGVEIGVFIGLSSHFFVRERLNDHLTHLMDGMYVNRYKQVVMGYSVIFISIFLLITLEYVIVLSSFKTPSPWMHEI